MGRSSLVARMQRRAEEDMQDTCLIQRRNGSTTGPGGVITAVWQTVHTGPCRVQADTESGSQQTVGAAVVLMARKELQLPISAPGLKEGDRVTITVAAYDPALEGKVYAVRDVPAKSEASARRVTIVEVVS